MSSFIVTAAHINAIVTAATKTSDGRGVSYYFKGDTTYINAETAEFIARTLYIENVRSVNYRYNERTRFNGFAFELDTVKRSPIAIIKLVNSLEYQSCERPDFAKSEAKAILTAISTAMVRQIDGYNGAAWTI